MKEETMLTAVVSILQNGKIKEAKPSSSVVCNSNADPDGDPSGRSFCSSKGSNSLTRNHTYNSTGLILERQKTFKFQSYALIKTNLNSWK
jgi:hypothetical protein